MKLTLAKATFVTLLHMVSSSLIAAENPVSEKQREENLTDSISSTKSNVTTTKEDKNSRYPVNFFDQYTPQNAMEMVSRLPGFTFDSGSDERGFGGNAGNVLINGARPTSKSAGLTDALERIPASQVMYIEIIRGGVSAGEAAGQSVVANVVKKHTQTSGTWGLTTNRTPNGVIRPKIEGSLAIKLGEWDTSFDTSLGGDSEYRKAFIERFDLNDVLTSSTDETLDALDEYFSINGEGSRKFAGGKLTINGSLGSNEWQQDTRRNTFNSDITYSRSLNEASSDELWRLNQYEDQLTTELGIDWVKVTNNWKIRAIALTSSTDTEYEHNENTEYKASEINDVIEANESNQYTKDTVETESILRMTYGKVGAATFKPEYGLEVANNRLESDITLIENGIPQDLEGAEAVEELRAEFFANFAYTLSPSLTLEGGLTYEISNIKAYSDSVQSQTFNFIKPRLSASYTLNDHSTITFVAEHSVEQLDFNDFAASADSTDDRTTSGNDNLQPEQVTNYSTLYDWRFSERGSLNLEMYIENRQDIHEDIFLPSGNSGLGNAGDAKFWGVITNINLPLDAVLENGLLEIEYSFKDSEFYDPIISDYRTIYDYIPNYLQIGFRHDVTQYNLSWGLEYKDSYITTTYYVDEIQTLETNNRLWELFIETTTFFNMKSRLEIQNVNVSDFTRTRYFYEDDRSGEFEGSEIAHREYESIVELSFSGSF